MFFFLAASLSISRPRRHVRLNPLEAQRVFQLTLGQQSPGCCGMLVDNPAQKRLGLACRRHGFITVKDCLVGNESPRIRLCIG